MRFDPKKIAVDYYFGDLQYWKLHESLPMRSKRVMTDPS